MDIPSFLLEYIDPWLSFLAADPPLRILQLTMIILVSIGIFLVFYATRDIMLRTHSILYTIPCILLVAFVPLVGFLLYLLIRPARTIKEREMYAMLSELSAKPKKKAVKKAATK